MIAPNSLNLSSKRMPKTLCALLCSIVLTGCQIGTFTDPSGTGSTANNAKNENTSSTVTLYWSAPLERVNGDAMSANDIGGYEIRYRLRNESAYATVALSASVNQWSITTATHSDNYIFEVAVFDTDGIYSDFVRAESSG